MKKKLLFIFLLTLLFFPLIGCNDNLTKEINKDLNEEELQSFITSLGTVKDSNKNLVKQNLEISSTITAIVKDQSSTASFKITSKGLANDKYSNLNLNVKLDSTFKEIPNLEASLNLHSEQLTNHFLNFNFKSKGQDHTLKLNLDAKELLKEIDPNVIGNYLPFPINDFDFKKISKEALEFIKENKNLIEFKTNENKSLVKVEIKKEFLNKIFSEQNIEANNNDNFNCVIVFDKSQNNDPYIVSIELKGDLSLKKIDQNISLNLNVSVTKTSKSPLVLSQVEKHSYEKVTNLEDLGKKIAPLITIFV